MKIKLSRDMSYELPSGDQKKPSFGKGEIQNITTIECPGERYNWDGGKYTSWRFLTSSDIMLAETFNETDIVQLILTQEERDKLPEQLPRHSFEVVIES